MRAKAKDEFGGLWTVEKLEILTQYLKAYTTLMKRMRFSLTYVDAFAGSGELSYRSDHGLNLVDVEKFYQGSAKRAIEVHDKPFDSLVFVEKDKKPFEQAGNSS